MPGAKYSREEIASRGEAIYEQDIRPKVEGQDKGKYVVLARGTRVPLDRRSR